MSDIKPRTLSLDEVANMTSQMNESTGEVTTRDLTPKSTYIPTPANGSLKPVDITDIAEFEKPKRVGQELIDTMFDKLDTAIERDKREMWENVVAPKLEEVTEKAILGSDEDDEYDFNNTALYTENTMTYEGDDMEDVNTQGGFNFDEEDEAVLEIPVPTEPVVEKANDIPVIPKEETTPVVVEKNEVVKTDIAEEESHEDIGELNLDNIFGKDVSDELSEEDYESSEAEIELSEEESQAEIKEMQAVIRKEANPISKIINLAEFTIGSKPVSSSSVLNTLITSTKVHSANWYMPNAGRSFTMAEISGAEIQKLDPSAETGLNELMRNKELYSVFYDHTIDANKPSTFEAWTKTVPFDDIGHLYFGAYRASFSHGSNLIPYYCNNPMCKHSFMEHKPINSMIKFKNVDIESKAKEIMAKDPTTEEYSIKSKLFQISNDVCIAFKNPSIYNVVFERAALPESFRNKFADLMYYISCIDAIYIIDHANKKLNKMSTKIEKDNINKTISNKYKSYAAILKNLRPDEYSLIPSFIKEVKNDHSEDIEFLMPETVCPKCGKKIEAIPMDPMTMLFTRLRLQTILVL